jgi:hypothetical protein
MTGGALILKANGTLERVTYLEHLSISLVLGIGVIGWTVFFSVYWVKFIDMH